jgi:hypothetical protein
LAAATEGDAKKESKSDKKQQKEKEKEKKKGNRKKGGSGLLFWKKGKGDKADRSVREEDTKTKTTAHVHEQPTEDSAVPTRERSGTTALYAAMGSGYLKQHDALAQ